VSVQIWDCSRGNRKWVRKRLFIYLFSSVQILYLVKNSFVWVDWFVGISRDSMHKRRATGGKKKAWRKKRK